MAAVYAYHEFTDLENRDHKIEIYDTTYSGSTGTFKTAGEEGYTITYKGIEGEILFSPKYGSSAKVNVLINQDTDAFMDALVDDIANAKEGQFWAKIYRKISGSYVLQWIGQLIPDASQVEDLAIKSLSLQFSDGLARLKDYPFTYAITDIYDKVTDLNMLIEVLKKANVEQFFGGSDVYISSNIKWYEKDQRKTYGALYDTRSMKYNYLSDVEALKPKTCADALDIILKKYGANIRFESGKWIVTQAGAWLNTVDYRNYSKSSTLLSTDSAVDESYAVVTGDPTATQIDSWKPCLKNVDVNIEAESYIKKFKYDYDRLASQMIAYGGGMGSGNLVIDYDLNVYTQGILWSVNKPYYINISITSPTLQVYTFLPNIEGNFYAFAPNGLANSSRQIRGLTIPVNLNAQKDRNVNRCQGTIVIRNTGNMPVGQNITITVEVVTNVLGTDDGKWAGWFSMYQLNSEFGDWTNKRNVDYQTTIATIIDASYEILEDSAVGDIDFAFCPQAIEVYTGSEWVSGGEWNIGTSVSSGYPITQLLTQEALYLQRKPRQIIQGTFQFDNYNSRYYLDYRSSKWIMISGEYNARMCAWTGVWMELLRQTSDTSTASTNPYRDKLALVSKDLQTLRDQFNAVNTTVAATQGQIGQLQDQVSQMMMLWNKGVAGYLCADIEGTDAVGSGSKLTLKIQGTSDNEFKIIAE